MPHHTTKESAILSKVRQMRADKGYSQTFVALKLGISQNAYSKIESGKSTITVGKLVFIADILEVDLQELVA